MTYQVYINKHAIKSLKKIDEPYYSKIKKSIYDLSNNPRPKGYKKLRGRNAYRIRVADYRIIYEIFDTLLVVDVINIGHRKNISK